MSNDSLLFYILWTFGRQRFALEFRTGNGHSARPCPDRERYLLAVFAHLAKVLRNGYAPGGGSKPPVREVLNGTMCP